MAFIAGRVVVTVFRARRGDRVTIWSVVRRDNMQWEGRRRAAANDPMASGGRGRCVSTAWPGHGTHRHRAQEHYSAAYEEFKVFR
jgi:hypothetical protein